MAGDDWKKREACKMASWIKPKMAHKQMVQRLLQVQANLILCFRAEEKIAIEKDSSGKTVIVPKGWQPICEKNLPYELTVSFLLTPDKPGYPQPIKLQEQHKALFPLNKQIGEESGKGISEWAAGGVKRVSPPSTPEKEATVQDNDLPTPEEEKQILKDAGMIPGEGEPLMDVISKYRSDLSKCTTRKEIGKVFKEFVAGSHPKEVMDEATNLANEAHKKAA